MTVIFEIFADGKKRGISVTTDAAAAYANAVAILTRKTASKDSSDPDFLEIEVRELRS